MTGTTHQMVALVTALYVLTLHPLTVGPVVATLALIAVMVGALTPDLDQPTANIWRRMLGGNTIGNIFQFFSGGHRHLTHSIVGILGISWLLHRGIHTLIAAAYRDEAMIVWWAFMVGYVSHSVADTLTDRGVPWFWPFKWHIRIPPGPEEVRVTTDSWVENVVVRGGLCIVGALLLSQYWGVVRSFFIS